MFNVIVTTKNGTEYYVGSDCSVTPFYDQDRAIKYEFEDYEDANNVMLDFMENTDWAGYEIDVVQM